MQRSIRLRPWQKHALEVVSRKAGPDFLAVATPGAGKTTFALTAALQDLASHPHRRVVVVAPTQHLKFQWSRAAALFGLQLQPTWSARDGRLPMDMHGVVVTYQQVAAAPVQLGRLAHDAFVIFDEVHHAGEERAWGDGLQVAFGSAGRRLSLSGTPFRSDTNAIPFVAYDSDEARPDFQYGYGDALGDGGVVRPVQFPRVNGEMEWTAADGTHHTHTFDDALDRGRAGQRLRTALSVDGEWLPAVLSRAHGTLRAMRASQADAGGLVIAIDQAHAYDIAALMRDRLGVAPTIATSEDPAASTKIARFAEGNTPWIVAVRMVSEGVDIPRLRVGVFATTTTTELFFRQAVGRLVRWTAGENCQQAAMFIPDDHRLRTWAAQIAEQRRHILRRNEDADDAVDEVPGRLTAPSEDTEQLSLFAPISAVTIGEPEHVGPHPVRGQPTQPVRASDGDDTLIVALAAPPLRGAGGLARDGDAGESGRDRDAGMTRHERKKILRDRNSDRAKALAQLTGMKHAHVNRELNRLAGVRRISEATVAQLERRLEHADRWLTRL